MSNENVSRGQVDSFEPSSHSTRGRLSDYPISGDNSLKKPTVRTELNQQQREEINKLLRYIINEVGTSKTIELLRELKTKVDYIV
jgi:hypothetical protein